MQKSCEFATIIHSLKMGTKHTATIIIEQYTCNVRFRRNYTIIIRINTHNYTFQIIWLVDLSLENVFSLCSLLIVIEIVIIFYLHDLKVYRKTYDFKVLISILIPNTLNSNILSDILPWPVVTFTVY